MAAQELKELNDVSDFESIASPDGCISICGFGSLLSEKSAKSTFPDLRNFRIGALRGFRRVFAHTAPIFFERGIARPETGVPDFIEREHEFRFVVSVPEDLSGDSFPDPAIVCCRYSDEEYFQNRCRGNKELFHHRYGRFNIEKIWRDDVLPCRVYLRHCVLAAKNLGEMAYNNFLDHTFLADRKTSIRQYLASGGSGILDEEPPEQLKERYGG
eukprot:TRINITY_DN3676_c0_g1_i1.p1 TRINITY_DN3676_c0_g1~~TRINITY_DN3676_c0_g1_i1.p1  ORF type:complete len:214 (+),score=24.13 TRINITY_DN3676_c0_g1_i1:164-805(+)